MSMSMANTGKEDRGTRPAASTLTDTVVRLIHRKAIPKLAKVLENMRPGDIGVVFWRLGPTFWRALFDQIRPREKAAEVLANLSAEILVPFCEKLSDAELVELLAEMSTDDAADVFELLPEERRSSILSLKSNKNQLHDVVELLQFPPDSAGGIMSPDVFALPQALTCGHALEAIRDKKQDFEMVFYLYATDDEDRLAGVCSLRDLVIAEPDAPLDSIMSKEVVSVTVDTDQEEVARLVARYDFLAIPVVDQGKKLVGIITVDDVLDVIREEATEDMLRMAGVSETMVTNRTSITRSIKSRLPWLLATFVAGAINVGIIGAFDHQIQQFAALAAFIPIVLGMGGNIGTQSATITTRAIALGRIALNRPWRSDILREILVGVSCGAAYGLLLGIVAAVAYHQFAAPFLLALTVGLSLLISMSVAATLGTLIPLGFHRLRIDPALASGPFVTTSTDLIGIVAYLSLSQVLFHHLIS